MNPTDIALVESVLRILAEMGSWPVGAVLLVVVVGPWLMAFFLAREQERRFEAVQAMYENNVKLVEGYEKLCQRQDNREGALRDLVQMNAQAVTRLTDAIQAGREFWAS